MPLQFDTVIQSPAGKMLASYGPRVIVGDGSIESPSDPRNAQFYGVYSHDDEGLAVWAGDTPDEARAQYLAMMVADVRTAPSPLTCAYIGKGVIGYLNSEEGAKHYNPDVFSGELGLMDNVVFHALMLDKKADAVETEFTGVYAYEVAEEFGFRMARAMCENREETAEQIADVLIAEATA